MPPAGEPGRLSASPRARNAAKSVKAARGDFTHPQKTWRVDAAGRIRRWARAFRGSLLFMPTLMTIGALVLFALTSVADSAYESDIRALTDGSGNALFGFLVFAGSDQTASSLLSSIVGTWATIVGVVFSVTLVTIQLSATKYSAQVIPVFERDPLNQVVLGSFTATFVYALLVLKTVRSEGEPFVPLIGVNVAVAMAIASIFMLIAFIGNLTAYIRPTRFVEDYARSGARALPSEEAHFGGGARPVPAPPEAESSRGTEIASSTGGFLTRVKWDTLREVIAKIGSVERVELPVAPGARVFAGDILIRLDGAITLDDEAWADLEGAIVVDDAANQTDAARIADNLADVGVTAMSGGATDVGVAKAALEGALGFTSAALMRPEPPAAFLLDVGGRDVLFVREPERFARGGLRAIKRILDKMAREGYWDLAETFTRHAAPLFRNAAASGQRETWDDVMEWFRPVARLLFTFKDDPVMRRLVRNLRHASAELRRDGHDEKALDLEHALIEAARDAGVAAEMREEIAAAFTRRS